MSFSMSLNFLIFLLGLCVFLTALLLSWRIYKIRYLKKEELLEGIMSSEPFFVDFDFISKATLKIFRGFVSLLCLVSRKLSPYTKKMGKKPRHYFCKVSDYMYGRKVIEKNGCSGYWNELNECTNGNEKGDSVDIKKDSK